MVIDVLLVLENVGVHEQCLAAVRGDLIRTTWNCVDYARSPVMGCEAYINV